MKRSIFENLLAGANALAKALAMSAAAAVVAVSCIADDANYSVLYDESLEAVSITLDLSAAAEEGGNEAARSRIATRDLVYINNTENEDNMIYDLWVIQFDATNPDAITTKTARHIADYQGSDKTVSLFPGDNMMILYVANSNNASLYSRLMTYEEIMAKTYGPSRETGNLANVNLSLVQEHNTGKEGCDRFVMSQLLTGKTISKESADDNKEALAAKLQRNVAKIEIVYGTLELGETNNKPTVTMLSCQVMNIPQVNNYTAFNIVDVAETTTDIYPAATVAFSSYDAVPFESTEAAGFDPEAGTGSNTLCYYVPVNMRGYYASTIAEKDWAAKYTYGLANLFSTATHFVVTGELDETVNVATGDKYSFTFTEYLGGTAQDFNLKPNHYYRFEAEVAADLTEETLSYWKSSRAETRFSWTKVITIGM